MILSRLRKTRPSGLELDKSTTENSGLSGAQPTPKVRHEAKNTIVGRYALPVLGTMSIHFLEPHESANNERLQGYVGKHRPRHVLQGFVARTVLDCRPGYQELVVAKQSGVNHPPVITLQSLDLQLVNGKETLVRSGKPSFSDDLGGAVFDLWEATSDEQADDFYEIYNRYRAD